MDDASKPAAPRVVEIPAGYTPPPWRAVACGGSDHLDEVFTVDGGQSVAYVTPGFPPRKAAEMDANARLIAIAPDLAAAYQAQKSEIDSLRAQVSALTAERSSMIQTHRENLDRQDQQIAKLTAERDRLLSAQGWQDIATAPKDGTTIFIFNRMWSCAPKAKWDLIDGDDGMFGAWVLDDDVFSPGVDLGVIGWNEDIEDGNMPTHWMLPPELSAFDGNPT